MSLDVLTAVWRDPPCKGGDLLCLLAIADNADEHGYAWPSVATIARKAAMGERGAQKCIKKLDEAGLINIKSGGGRNKTNAYQITTNGIGEHLKHINPEQNTPSPGSPFSDINPEQSDINPEPAFAKPRTPVHPNSQEPSKEPPLPAAAGYLDYLEVHPNSVESEAGEGFWDALISEGVDPSQIIAAAKAYAEKSKTFSDRKFIQQSDNFLSPDRGKWKANIPAQTKAPPTESEVLYFYAKTVIDKKPSAASVVSSTMANRLLAADLVTPDQLKAAGVAQ